MLGIVNHFSLENTGLGDFHFSWFLSGAYLVEHGLCADGKYALNMRSIPEVLNFLLLPIENLGGFLRCDSTMFIAMTGGSS